MRARRTWLPGGTFGDSGLFSLLGALSQYLRSIRRTIRRDVGIRFLQTEPSRYSFAANRKATSASDYYSTTLSWSFALSIQRLVGHSSRSASCWNGVPPPLSTRLSQRCLQVVSGGKWLLCTSPCQLDLLLHCATRSNTIDVSTEVASQKRVLIETIVQFMQTRFGNNAPLIKRVLFVGGGSSALEPELRRMFPSAVFARDPQMANARGMFIRHDHRRKRPESPNRMMEKFVIGSNSHPGPSPSGPPISRWALSAARLWKRAASSSC